MKKETIRKIVFWTSICITVLMVVLIAIDLIQNIKSQQDFEDLREIVNNATATTTTDAAIEPTAEPTTESPTETMPAETSATEVTTETETTTIEETTTAKKEILVQYQELYEINNHLAGWLKIDGTVIDYPVLEVEGDNDYYLKRNFYGKTDKNGQLIFDFRCDFERPSTNIIIHGHRMSSGAMFGSLKNYKKKSYYEEHKYVQFDTLYDEGNYEIFAVFLSKHYNNVDDVFKYYNFIDAASEEEYNYFIENVKALSLYDTGITPVYGEELLTLSTCDYYTENGRLVVVARKLAPAKE